MSKANPIVATRIMKNVKLNKALITFKYFELSFLTKQTILNITPKKQLITVAVINGCGITGRPSLALIEDGIEFNRSKNKVNVNAENIRDNFEYKFVFTFSSVPFSARIFFIQLF